MKKRLILIAIILVVIALSVGGVLYFIKPSNDTQTTQPDLTSNIVLRDNGSPRFIDGSVIKTKIDSDEKAFIALDEVKDMFGFKKAADEFNIIKKEKSLDFTYYKLNQKYKGVNIYGRQLSLSVDKDNKASSISGDYFPGIDMNVYSGMIIQQVRTKLEAALVSDYKILASDKYIYIDNNTPVLSYIFTVVNANGVNDIVMKALDGSIISTIKKDKATGYDYTGLGADGKEYTITLDKKTVLDSTDYTFHDPNRNITIVDAYHVGVNTGTENLKQWINLITSNSFFYGKQLPISTKILDNGSFLAPDLVLKNAVNAQYSMSVAYDYYKNVLGRNSFDNNGKEIIVNIGVSENFLAFDEFFNAFWMGDSISKFAFGSKDGVSLAAAVDIAAHEYTHAVSDSIVNFTYKDSSGALSESYSDIMGNLIEGKNFSLGEDILVLRDMVEPNKYEDPDTNGGRYSFPADEGVYNQTWRTAMLKKFADRGEPLDDWRDWDNGGVHTNSGIPNHAAYIMYNNGAFKDKQEMAKVWYNSLFLLTSTSDFEDCALAVIQTAKNLKLSTDKITIIENAFIETKMLGDNYAKLSGTVLDSATNKPLEGARVTVINKKNPSVYFELSTDKNGKYIFPKLQTTDYVISIEKGKYKTQEVNTTLLRDSKDLDVKLEAIKEADYSAKDIIFVLDISMSMDVSDPTDIRKQIMSNILSSLNNDSKVALIIFNKNDKLINSGLTDKYIDKKILITDVFNMANDNGGNENSGTNGKAGIKKALSLFDNNSKTRKYIVFLTDGMDNVAEGSTYEQLISQANDMKIRILTIGLGSGKDINEVELKNIANKTNGKYYYASSSIKLYNFDSQIFDEIK